ncbi:adenine-specific DNA-methyltransferase [Nitrosospira multiformis]|uniref:Methyltransferase n=1 Tax=Nitrosospira multiformis TaxID=1231 RepID=A0A1H8KVG9_9PROT|nr:site-specific DNA-methyltransferase [Nitrosospira multiformis]SEN96596.1 adenine-specific DNA-methyltransferase [Nitrosospira multiformis]
MNDLIFKDIETLITRVIESQAPAAGLFEGDCIELVEQLPNESVDLTVTSPPYCMGKKYEAYSDDIETFILAHRRLLPEIIRITKPGGSICWQVGFHVKNNTVIPLDFLIYDILKDFQELQLRNRIVWTFGHGLHCRSRFSGRYEIILWYTKGAAYYFDLDAVRVPQKYPGKRYSKGPRKGEFSGNPKGKNPSDIWEIPNVKANHVEKTQHPCQFPVALVQRLVRALTQKEGVVLDPFAGVASAGVAALLEKRRFVGAELDEGYIKTAQERLLDTLRGTIQARPLDREIYIPKTNEKVATKPDHFWTNTSPEI